MENKFDEIIKKSALNHQEEYRPEFWNAFESKLNAQSKAKTKNNNWSKFAAGAAVLVASVAAIYYFTDNKEPKPIEKQALTENKIDVSTSNSKAENADKDKASLDNTVVVVNDNKLTANQNTAINAEQIKAETTNLSNTEEKQNFIVNEDIKTDNPLVEKSENKLVINLKKTLVCEGEEVLLTANNIPENATISWDFGDGKSSNKKQASHTFTKAGNYVIELNCFIDKKLVQKENAQIIVASNPKADFEWTDKNELEENYTISYTDQSYDAVKWDWNFGDKQTANSQQAIHTYKGQGTYAATLIVTNVNGCKDQKTKFITVIDQNPLLAPNSFSPNGDGLNDYFMPKALENSNVNFELKILDRTGNIVYQTNDSNKPWNGRMNNSGEMFNNGTPFIWMVTITTPEGKIKRFNGTINIVN
jgi:gliding motility-associated-like protein